MKLTVMLFLLAICAILAIVSYTFGELRGQEFLGLRNKASFVITLSAMEKIRSGKQEEALKIIENHCYSSALMLMADNSQATQVGTSNLLNDLFMYRSQYATNRAVWTPIEQNLESLSKQR